MFIEKKHISRRTALRGMGSVIALPFLDSMLPAMMPARLAARKAAAKPRLACVEIVHGLAGSNFLGAQRHLWAPAGVGSMFDLTQGNLAPLEPFKSHLTLVSNTDMHMADPIGSSSEIGGDDFRSSAVFLTQAHPKQTTGPDLFAGTSLDQLYAQRVRAETRVPSMQLTIEELLVPPMAGSYGYAPEYQDLISWASPTQPLPMIRDPQAVFNTLIGVGGLDGVTAQINALKLTLPASDQARLDQYLELIRDVERRLKPVEALSYSDHVKLMFDLQAIAFAGDVTRVSSFKMSRSRSNRVFPESGVDQGFYSATRYGSSEARILEFGKINQYHVGLVSYFIEQLGSMPDVNGTLLDNSVVLYGSPTGDGNLHSHRRVGLFAAGHAAGQLKGGLHRQALDGTPSANFYLSLLHKLGLDDVKSFGDSTGELALA